MDSRANQGSSAAPQQPPPLAPCDVSALQKCLQENNGDKEKCLKEVQAFQQACSRPTKSPAPRTQQRSRGAPLAGQEAGQTPGGSPAVPRPAGPSSTTAAWPSHDDSHTPAAPRQDTPKAGTPQAGLPEAASPEEDTVLLDFMARQLESLLAEKSRLADENARLARENDSLQDMLSMSMSFEDEEGARRRYRWRRMSSREPAARHARSPSQPTGPTQPSPPSLPCC
eukprot:jgi/Tetstr1/425318/TSEL_015768.t1